MTTIAIVLIIVVVIVLVNYAKHKQPQNEKTPFKTYDAIGNEEIEIEEKYRVAPSDIKGNYLVFDLETTGLPPSKYTSVKELNRWPHVLQIAWQMLDSDFNVLAEKSYYTDFKGHIPIEASRVNGITSKMLREKGVDIKSILSEFLAMALSAEYLVGHNIEFDYSIIKANLYRHGFGMPLENARTFCTMESSKEFVQALNKNGALKRPRLSELYEKCFNESNPNGNFHNAAFDVETTKRCLHHLVKNDIVAPTGVPIDFDIELRRRVQKYRTNPDGGLVYPSFVHYGDYYNSSKRNLIDSFVQNGSLAEKALDFNSAIDYYKKAIDAGVRYTNPYDRLRIIYRKRKEWDKVIDIINKCLDDFESRQQNSQSLDRFYEYLEKEMLAKEARALKSQKS